MVRSDSSKAATDEEAGTTPGDGEWDTHREPFEINGTGSDHSAEYASKGERGVIGPLQGHSWKQYGDVRISGLLYNHGEYVAGTEAHKLFGDVRTAEDLRERLEECSGTFSVLLHLEDRVLAASGPAPASTELFYSKQGGGYLTDRYRWLEHRLPPDSYSERIATEVMLSGMIHGRETLHPNVYQLQAGEILSIPRGESGRWKSIQYYEPAITDEVIADGRLVEELEGTLDRIFTRLKQAAEDRPILLALSGGYDSRLLALMLHRHDFENVYAYGLNTQSGFDLRLSEQVADRLGFEWVGFEYTQDDLREMYESEFWHRVNDAVGDHGAVEPHATTALTIKNIVEHPDLPDKGIKLGGDTPADAVGNYLTRSFFTSDSIEREEIVEILLGHYFGNDTIYSDTREEMRDKILRLVDIDEAVSTETAIGILSRWHWLYRESRMRHNVFKTAGFEVCDPYLEMEFFDFIAGVPPQKQYKRDFIERYTERLNEKHLPEVEVGADRQPTTSYGKKAEAYLKTHLERRVTGSTVEDPVRFVRDRQLGYNLDKKEAYTSNLKFGFMSFDRFEKEYTGTEHYSYFLAEDELSRSRSRPDGSRVVPENLLSPNVSKLL